MSSDRRSGSGASPPDDPGPRRANPTVWVVRIATVAMLIAAIVVGVRKFRTTPEQEELERYAELTVPAYLKEVAVVEERLDKLAGESALKPDEARTLLVDEVMPLAIRARKHAGQVVAQSETVKALNAEYAAAVDKLLEVGRTGVRAIDDPTLSGEEGHKQVRERKREADEALRAWTTHVRERCEKAGFQLRAVVPKAESNP